MMKTQGGNGGGKTWSKHINKKGRANEYQKKQQSDKKANVNGDTKSNNVVHLVDVKWMCLSNKGCGFNNSYTTGFHDTWAARVQNNKPFTLPATHLFQNKMAASIVTVTQFASNN